MKIGRFFVWVLSGISALSYAKLPELKATFPEYLQKCLKNSTNKNPNLTEIKDAEWSLKCSASEFFKQTHEENYTNPGLRLLIARILRLHILELRNEALRGPASGFIPPQKFIESGDYLSQHSPIFRSKNTPVPPRDPIETPEGTLINQTNNLIEEAKFWLRPLYKSSTDVLAKEALVEMFRILGDSLRFISARTLLVMENKTFRMQGIELQILKYTSEWVESYGAAPLRPYFLDRLKTLRSYEISGQKEEELFYWVQSLLLEGADGEKEKNIALKRLRELAVVFTTPQQVEELKKTVSRLGLSESFNFPKLADMTLAELILRAQSLVRNLQTHEALQVMSYIEKLPSESLESDSLWDAFNLHVRILRILDQRKKVPAVIQKYIKLGRFLEIQSKSEDIEKFMNRSFQIAKFYWNYENSSSKALSIVNKIIELNAKFKTDYSLGRAYYIKARIMEQEIGDERVFAFYDNALRYKMPDDMKAELLWRRVYLNFDLAARNGDPSKLPGLLKNIEKDFSNDVTAKSMWNYWYAEALEISGNKEGAIAAFKKAYEIDPFSYYSNMAGIELSLRGETPDNWDLPSGDYWKNNYEWAEPEWTQFFSENGKPSHGTYESFSRAYYLAFIGDYTSARKAFQSLDRVLWQHVLSSKINLKRRREFAQAVSWLRFAVGDPVGGLRSSELLRQISGKNIEENELALLYPLPYWDLIEKQANSRNVDPWITASLIRQESAFNPKAKSSANALGLMQMIPPVAQNEASLVSLRDFKSEHLYEPQKALLLGVHHLSRLKNLFQGSWICTIASYNAGTPPVVDWLNYYYKNTNTLPMIFIERISYLETRGYVKSILRNYINYQRIFAQGLREKGILFSMPKIIPRDLVNYAP